MRPTTLLFDLDGVLRTWPKNYSDLEANHDLPAGSIGRTAFEPPLLEQVITGKIADAVWRAEVGRRLALAYPASRARDAVEAWSQPSGEINHEVLRIIRDSRAACTIGLITNATDRLPGDLKELGLIENLDFIINSSEVGLAKPNQAIFRVALERACAQPSEVLFIDDTPANVAAASALGIRSHHFAEATGLRKFLHSAGLGANAA